MKIHSQPEIPLSATPSASVPATKAGQGAAARATKDATSAGVAVTVSTFVRTLEQSNRGEAADVDHEKVNAIRTAIAQGTYSVNPEAIADKLLANAQEMLDRTRS
jgi:negative regulator of flagellin synthesis FlgM